MTTDVSDSIQQSQSDAVECVFCDRVFAKRDDFSDHLVHSDPAIDVCKPVHGSSGWFQGDDGLWRSCIRNVGGYQRIFPELDVHPAIRTVADSKSEEAL